MKRFLKRRRHPRNDRWSEETHMMVAGLVTICLVFGIVFAWGKLGAPVPMQPVVKAATK